VASRANVESNTESLVTLDAEQRIARAIQALVFYVGKTLWPAGLSPFYPVQPERLSLLAPETLLAGTAIAAALVVAVRLRRTSPWLGAALAAHGAVLLPVLGFVQHGEPALAADRYTYIGTLGLDLLVGVGLARLWRGAWARPVRRAAVAAAVLLVGLTAAQVRAWRTTESLWRHALAVTRESAFALNNLGFDLMHEGRLAEAEPLLARAVSLEPRDVRAALNYGVTIERLGRVDAAIGFYAGALRALPDVAELHYNLGALLARQGRFRDARPELERAVALKPGWATPREALARLPSDAPPPRALGAM
jgi:tetratricopeptide (TPR) repeat protein